ncbi:MAG: MerR family transcriptional regulator [Myxococcales bacterium]|nr:MerR family transcriptional regulator [Myxococcales bacterium]
MFTGDGDTAPGYSIAEFAERGGVTRRTVRYYVQRGLLDPPEGAGRGARYTDAHLRRLERVRTLQEQGYSLDRLTRLLDAPDAPTEPTAPTAPRHATPSRTHSERAAATASGLPWWRVPLGDGVELHLRADRFDPDTAERVHAAVRAALSPDHCTPEGGHR